MFGVCDICVDKSPFRFRDLREKERERQRQRQRQRQRDRDRQKQRQTESEKDDNCKLGERQVPVRKSCLFGATIQQKQGGAGVIADNEEGRTR